MPTIVAGYTAFRRCVMEMAEKFRLEFLPPLGAYAVHGNFLVWNGLRHSIFPAFKNFLNAPVGHQPQQRHKYVKCVGQPHAGERQWDGGSIKHRRQPALPVAAHRAFQQRIAACAGDDACCKIT